MIKATRLMPSWLSGISLTFSLSKNPTLLSSTSSKTVLSPTLTMASPRFVTRIFLRRACRWRDDVRACDAREWAMELKLTLFGVDIFVESVGDGTN